MNKRFISTDLAAAVQGARGQGGNAGSGRRSLRAESSGGDLWNVEPGRIWRWLKVQPASFWFVCLYLAFEYLHPQIIYPTINVLPWGYALMAASGLALLLEGRGFRLPTVVGGLVAVYAAVVLISAATAWSPSAAVAGFPYFFDWFWAILLIVSAIRTEKQFFVFMLLYLLCSFKMSQHGARSWAENGFGFASWGVTGSPVWFHNSGEFGVQMCIFLPISLGFYIALRKYWGRWTKLLFLSFPLTAVMSIIASSSRGALVGGALVLGWAVLRSRHRIRSTLVAGTTLAVVMAVIPPEQKARFESVGEDNTSESRLEVWRNGVEIANRHPVLGIGFGNWSPYSAATYGRPLQPHNVFIQAWAELGYIGLASMLSLVVATFWLNWQTRVLARSLPLENEFFFQMGHGLDGALIGFLGSGFFVTVLYYPFLWINLALTISLHMALRDKATELRVPGAGAAGRPLRHRRLATVDRP